MLMCGPLVLENWLREQLPCIQEEPNSKDAQLFLSVASSPLVYTQTEYMLCVAFLFVITCSCVILRLS